MIFKLLKLKFLDDFKDFYDEISHFQKFVVKTVTSGKPISCSGGVFAEWKGRFFSFESRPGLAETVLILLLRGRGVRTGWDFPPENRWKCLSYLFTPGDREAWGRFTGNQEKGRKWYGKDFGEGGFWRKNEWCLLEKGFEVFCMEYKSGWADWKVRFFWKGQCEE